MRKTSFRSDVTYNDHIAIELKEKKGREKRRGGGGGKERKKEKKREEKSLN